MASDGNGDVTVFRVDIDDAEIIPDDQFGKFYAGDTYAVIPTVSENSVIYIWIGNESPLGDKDDEIVSSILPFPEGLESAPLMKIRQGNEPSEFRRLFSETGMIVYSSGAGCGQFASASDTTSPYSADRCIFHVKDAEPGGVPYAVSIEKKASNINGEDCFILLMDGLGFLWRGKGCSEESLEVGKKYAGLVAGDSSAVLEMNEGEEMEDFWEQLGGKEAYPETRPEEVSSNEVKLFLCGESVGDFKEMPVGDQKELGDEFVFVLNTDDSLYVWVGSNADQSVAKSIQRGEHLKASIPGVHGVNVPITVVKAKFEHSLFTSQFKKWEATLSDDVADSTDKSEEEEQVGTAEMSEIEGDGEDLDEEDRAEEERLAGEAKIVEGTSQDKNEDSKASDDVGSQENEKIDEVIKDEEKAEEELDVKGKKVEEEMSAKEETLEKELAAEEETLKKELEAEEGKLAAEAAEQKRLEEQKEAEETRLAEEKAAEEKQKAEAEAAETKRLEEEAAEAKKKADEEAAEAKRLEEEQAAEAKKKADEEAAEAKRLEEEKAAEEKKKADEEKAEAEAKRLAEKKAAEEERIAEAKRKAEAEKEEEKKRLEEEASQLPKIDEDSPQKEVKIEFSKDSLDKTNGSQAGPLTPEEKKYRDLKLLEQRTKSYMVRTFPLKEVKIKRSYVSPLYTNDDELSISLPKEELLSKAEKVSTFHSLAELKDKIDGVDFKHREMYLSNEDFQTVFEMSKEDFYEMPKWRRENAKRRAGIF